MEDDIVNLYPWLLRQARKYYRERMDIEDLVEDTVYKILANRQHFDNSRSIKPWCISIMQNIYITEYKRKQLIRFVPEDDCYCALSKDRASDKLSFMETLHAINNCRRSSCCIDCAIYYAKGYSYDEISEILGIPVGTVRSRISTARSLIRKELEL